MIEKEKSITFPEILEIEEKKIPKLTATNGKSVSEIKKEHRNFLDEILKDAAIYGNESFVFKRMTLKDYMSVGIDESRNLQGTQPSDVIKNLAHYFAIFPRCLVKYPSNFDLDNIENMGILDLLYTHYMSWVRLLRGENISKDRGT